VAGTPSLLEWLVPLLSIYHTPRYGSCLRLRLRHTCATGETGRQDELQFEVAPVRGGCEGACGWVGKVKLIGKRHREERHVARLLSNAQCTTR